MKKTTITIAAALLAGSMGLGTLISQAAEVEYEDATNARTEGTVIILENDSSNPVIPDPENPGEEVDPEVPVNPHPGRLRINYVSNFDFGKIPNISSEIVQEARLDHIFSGTSEEGRVPFVATEDRRGSDRLGWELQVSQPKQLSDASGHELQGATITLSGLRYVNPTSTLATANASQGAGAWTLALGNANAEGQTDGVVLRIPANTTKNDTAYSTALVWELVADPTNASGE